MSGAEPFLLPLLLPIGKVALLKLSSWVAAHYGAIIASHAVGYGAGKAMPYITVHAGNSALAKLGFNYASGTLSSAANAATALGSVVTVSSASWGAYSYVTKVAELRAAGWTLEFPLTQKVGRKNADKNSKLLEQLVTAALQLVDMVVAAQKHRGSNGQLKTRVDQLAECTTKACPCTDFDKKGVNCRCSCPSSVHRRVTFKQHFVRGGPGSKILYDLASALYKDCARLEPSSSPGECVAKSDLGRDAEYCTDCGCTDFISEYWGVSSSSPQSTCLCTHSKKRHKPSQIHRDSTGERAFFTNLAVVVDFLYMSLNHEGVVIQDGESRSYKKTSVYEIRARVGCEDFDYRDNTNFTRWFLVASEVQKRAYCRCGSQYYQHSLIRV